MTNEQIMKEAQKRYEKWGAGAVYDYANHMKWEDWSVCEQCGATTPTINNSCMVCGTKK